ncbi:MAG: sulfotransferase [Candidatus Rokubacteria bacterium]|nr:sulfotransferase [Candidatus Rokubacteria bacterium]
MLFSARLPVAMRLLRTHGHVRPARYPQVAAMLAVCAGLQRFIRKEDELYQARVQHEPIVDDPVFILGHWRSGTTNLHYLLGLDAEKFAAPSTYQCFFPTVFLTLGERSWLYRMLDRTLGTRRRVTDNVTFKLDSPAEEDRMYLAEGAFSYITERLMFPRTAVTDPAEILRRSTDEESRRVTLRIFKKLTYAHGKRILSKSPGHFSRIPVLRELFPKSRFVVIVRHPYDVVASMVSLERRIRPLVALQKHRPFGIADAARVLAFYVAVADEHLGTVSAAQRAVLRYEDLVADPVRTLQDVYQRLGLEFSSAYEQALTHHVEAQRGYRRNTYALSPADRDLIHEHCAPIFERHGYER